MTIVLNETEWAEEMIAEASLGKKPFETLCRVARYYINSGFNKSDARRKLETFLLRCDPSASLTKWSGALDKAMVLAAKFKAINIDGIIVTDRELEKIEELASRQLRRLAFTLLCLSKYWSAIQPNSGGWVNNKDCDIMKMADIRTSLKRQSAMYHKLNELGYIQFSKKVDNTNVKVCFAEDGDPKIKVTDFRNLGYQYLMFCGEPFFVCQNCGVVSKLNNPVKGRKQKYCRECAVQVKVQQDVNSAMRMRKKAAQYNRDDFSGLHT